MVKTPSDRGYLSFPNAQSVKDVLPQLIPVATRYGLNYGCMSSSQLYIATHLTVCKEAIVAVTPLRFRKVSVMSFLTSGALMILLGSA